MSETTTEATGTAAEGTEQETVKPTETVDFWKQKAREQEKRAKENADAARRLAEIEESQKTEAQKTSERLAEAERKALEAEARVLRRDVAIEHKLAAEDAALLDTITDEAAMRALAERLSGVKDTSKPPHVSREGHNSRTADDPVRSFANELFGRAQAD